MDCISYYTILWFSTYWTLLPWFKFRANWAPYIFFLKGFLSFFMRLYYLVKNDVKSVMLTCGSSQNKSWLWEFFVYFLIVYLVDVFNMIEAFRENGLNTLDHNTELHETRLEAIVSSIFYALNKRLPTTHYIDVERSISLVTNWLLYAYDRWDLLNCKKSSFKGTGNYFINYIRTEMEWQTNPHSVY